MLSPSYELTNEKIIKNKEDTERDMLPEYNFDYSKAKTNRFAIKREALEADQTISDFMLACFNAYIKK